MRRRQNLAQFGLRRGVVSTAHRVSNINPVTGERLQAAKAAPIVQHRFINEKVEQRRFMIAAQRDDGRGQAGGQKPVDHPGGIWAAIDIIAQQNDDRILAGVVTKIISQFVGEDLQQVQAPMYVADGVDAQPVRQARGGSSWRPGLCFWPSKEHHQSTHPRLRRQARAPDPCRFAPGRAPFRAEFTRNFAASATLHLGITLAKDGLSST